MAVPASLYAASTRRRSGRWRSPEYANGMAVRRIRTNGEVKWRSELVYVSTALIGEPVGIEEGEDGVWRVWFGPVLLGSLDASGRLRRPSAARAASSVKALRTSGAAPERTENCVTPCRIEVLPMIPVAQGHDLRPRALRGRQCQP